MQPYGHSMMNSTDTDSAPIKKSKHGSQIRNRKTGIGHSVSRTSKNASKGGHPAKPGVKAAKGGMINGQNP